MNFFRDLMNVEFWRGLTENDFNCGYLAGAGLVLGLLFVLLLVHIFLKLLFRTRRSGTVIVPNPDGDLVISRDAVENAARHVLSSYEQLSVRRIQLYRRGKIYFLTLFCNFSAGEKGLPELSGELKVQLLEMLEKMFGITTLKRVRIQVEKLALSGEAAPEAESKPDPVYVAPGF